MSLLHGHHRQLTGTEAREALSELLTQELGVSISPEQIRVLFERRWSRLQILAHAAHDNHEPPATAQQAALDAMNRGQPQ
jgi:hypothetical protein